MELGPSSVHGDASVSSVKPKKRRKTWWRDGEKKEGKKRLWWSRLCSVGNCVFRSKLDGSVSSIRMKNGNFEEAQMAFLVLYCSSKNAMPSFSC